MKILLYIGSLFTSLSIMVVLLTSPTLVQTRPDSLITMLQMEATLYLLCKKVYIFHT